MDIMEKSNRVRTKIMPDYSITLKTVYSCPADQNPEGLNLPKGFRLLWHQAETLKAIQDPQIDVIFNLALTADGKSLSAYLSALQGYFPILGMYPTNELSRDQRGQIEGYVELFKPQDEPRINRLSGAELELFAEREGKTKAIALETQATQTEILLTNPDIFHYLHRGAYLIPYDNPDKLWNRIDKHFNLFLFDEFHVFSAPQIASVINTMLLIRRTNQQKKYLFLSATPDEGLLERLSKVDFRYRVIDPAAEGKYAFPETLDEFDHLSKSGWRKISSELELSFIPLESRYQASEDWLKENKEQILTYFQEYPGSKGAIILNSIAAVKRLVPFFREHLAAYGLTVGENTGLSGMQEKTASLDQDLVIGTSTIDLGIDFKINFLIFESSDSGNFIQRLGRLGRHTGYYRNGEQVKFTHFKAIALTPKYLVGRLFEEKEAPLQVGERYDRITLQEAIRSNYRRINNFEGYYKRWGAVQSSRIYYSLGKSAIQSSYPESREKFRQDCEAVFGVDPKRVAGRIKSWSEEWQEISGKPGNPILEDAASFRGSSPLLCALYDPTEPDVSDRFKTYDLPSILGNLDVEVCRKGEFFRKVKEANTAIATKRFDYCLAFMKLKGYREVRSNWRFTYEGDLGELAQAWRVQVLTGIGIWQPDNPWSDRVSRELSSLGCVSYVLPYPVVEVRQRLQLPMHFGIYPISDENSIHNPVSPYSIAIGQSALLLDTLAYRFKDRGGEVWIC
jgi:CRISPR-associated endonuclease/helicase Cas3